MNRFRWVAIIALICLPVAFLALDWRIPGYAAPGTVVRPLGVPEGDQEMAWLHTTTANTTWERFVAGWIRAQRTMPDLEIDLSKAFLDSTTAVPEMIVSQKGHEGRLLIRWYKLQGDITAADWVKALAKRDRPPLAIIGGGSSDRAVDLAQAMEAHKADWPGDPPALFITTATANSVASAKSETLVDIYDHLTFRFCFTNRQMADAVLDFVESNEELRDDLRPVVHELTSLQAVASTAAGYPRVPKHRPHVFSVRWQDDPYSTDLHEQFIAALNDQVLARNGNQTAFHLNQFRVPFSVGQFQRPNADEDNTARFIAKELRGLPAQRSMLILPGSTQPARRLLQAIAERSQRLAHRLVVVTGDGISVNSLLRDGEFAWRAGALAVPLVLFTHNDPIAWDDGIRWPRGPNSDASSTEDLMHFAEMARVIAQECFPATGELANRSDDLIARLHARRPAFFDKNGERLGGTGEFIVTLIPRDDAGGGRGTAQLSVWKRGPGKKWELVGQLAVGAGPP